MSNNSGRTTSKAAGGQTVVQEYPVDNSSWKGSAEAERGKELAGSCTDLSHSLSGASTSDNGASARGKRETLSEPSKIRYGK